MACKPSLGLIINPTYDAPVMGALQCEGEIDAFICYFLWDSYMIAPSRVEGTRVIQLYPDIAESVYGTKLS